MKKIVPSTFLILLLLDKSYSSKDVLVIGAGVSGLVAGVNLIKNGFNVTILEGSNYIGGRVKTVKFGGFNIELGAEWVHGSINNSVYELMKQYDAFIKKNRESEDEDEDLTKTFITQNGRVMRNGFNSKLDKFYEEMESNEKNSLVSKLNKYWHKNHPDQSDSIGHFTTQFFHLYNKENPIDESESIRNATLDWLERLSILDNPADSWFDASHSDIGEQFEYLEGDYFNTWKPPFSYSSLINVILDEPPEKPFSKIPHFIKLGQTVSKIEYTTSKNGKTVVKTVDGKVYKADHVICTVSLGVLKSQHLKLFKPALPIRKQLAIEKIGFGTIMKFFMEFDNPWWLQLGKNFRGINPLWVSDSNLTLDSNLKWLATLSDEELMKNKDGLPIWTRGVESFSTIDSGSHPNALEAWITAIPSKFVERQKIEIIGEGVFKLLQKLLVTKIPNIPSYKNVTMSKWHSNELTRGTYSYRTVESENYDVWASDLARPIYNIFNKPILLFGGEATHSNFFSTVHGAFDSGVREAERLIEYYD